MICPYCHSDQLVVTNSRPTRGGVEIWRRRECLKCKEKITTHEKIDLSYVLIVKRDGGRVRYNRAKLYSGIYSAIANTKKIDRGSAGALAEDVVDEVEKQIVTQKIREIKSVDLLTAVGTILKTERFDSFLRYLAYFAKEGELRKLVTAKK